MKYVPASSFAILNLTGRTEKRIYTEYKKTPNWWEPNSWFEHPYMLITAFYGIEEPDFREKYNIPKEGFELFGDSGGFQNYKGDRGLKPLDVLRWQEKNCDIGFSLDYPLIVKDNGTDVKIKNKYSINNINNIINKRENYDMGYYACVHGWNEKQIKDYHNSLPKDGIDGWGVGECSATDDSAEGIISRIALEVSLNENKLPMHILGCCSALMIGFLALVEKKEGITISYDSTAYSNGAMYRWFHLNGMKKDKAKLNADVSDKDVKLLLKECGCPICKDAKISDLKGSDSEAGTLISLHNLWHEIQMDKDITKMTEKPKDLFKFLWKGYNDRGRYNRIIRMMKEYLDTDLDRFVKKYPYNNKFNAHRNVQLESWLGVERTELKMAEERLQKSSKKKKAKKKVEIVKEEPKYELKDEDWDI